MRCITLICFILRGRKRFLLFSQERVVAVPGIQCDPKLLQTFALSNKATRFFNLLLKTENIITENICQGPVKHQRKQNRLGLCFGPRIFDLQCKTRKPEY